MKIKANRNEDIASSYLTPNNRSHDDECCVRGRGDREQHQRVGDADDDDEQSTNVILDDYVRLLLYGKTFPVIDEQRHHDHF